MRRLAWAAVGGAALGLPMLPVPGWVGAPDPGPDWGVQLEAWAIGLLVVIAAGVLAGRLATRVRFRPSWPRRVSAGAIAATLAVLLLGAAAFTAHWSFAANPHLVDEMAQLFQARVFASGRLAAPPPDLPEHFLLTHTWITPSGWVSQFPPIHSVLLAAGTLLDAEWIVNPVLGGATAVLLYVLARGLYGSRTAVIAALLWVTSAWVISMSATYMNHASAAALAVGAWGAVWGPRRARPLHYALAGLALGALAGARPLDALAAAVPIGFWVLTRRRWSAAALIAVGAVPVAAALGYVNWTLYGNPLRFGYSVLYGAEHAMGFHADPWGNAYTPLVGLSNMTAAIRRLHIYLFEWPLPALLPFGLWALLARHRHPADAVVGWGATAGPLLYFLYWHSGFYPGPRFYYIAAPLLVLGTARALVWGWKRARRRARRVVRWDVAFAGAAIVVVLWGAVGLLPARLRTYRAGLPSLKYHPERTLQRAGVAQALVLVPESWGARVIVGLWALGVRPGLVERAYRRADLCNLHLLVSRAREGDLDAATVTDAVERLAGRSGPPAPLVSDWPDPTVRLRPRAEIPPPCVREMRRDLQGFALYGSHGWRNAVTLDRGIVFARDLYDRNDALLRRYAGWEVWRFAPTPEDPRGPPVLARWRETEEGGSR